MALIVSRAIRLHGVVHDKLLEREKGGERKREGQCVESTCPFPTASQSSEDSDFSDDRRSRKSRARWMPILG